VGAQNGIDTCLGRAYFENPSIVIVGENKLKGEYIFLLQVQS
jgi:glutathione reductase (NADPH)